MQKTIYLQYRQQHESLKRICPAVRGQRINAKSGVAYWASRQWSPPLQEFAALRGTLEAATLRDSRALLRQPATRWRIYGRPCGCGALCCLDSRLLRRIVAPNSRCYDRRRRWQSQTPEDCAAPPQRAGAARCRVRLRAWPALPRKQGCHFPRTPYISTCVYM